MPKTEAHISPTNIMRATGIGHHFSICRKGETWVDREAQAEARRVWKPCREDQQLGRELAIGYAG